MVTQTLVKHGEISRKHRLGQKCMLIAERVVDDAVVMWWCYYCCYSCRVIL